MPLERRPFATCSPSDQWIGGVLQSAPEDFRVEEIPLYPPAGEGEHLFVRIEKTGRTTEEAVQALSTALGVSPGVVGFAGRKDKQSVSGQTLSFPAEVEGRLPAVSVPGVRVLDAARHGRKLGAGHLAGNRFRIVVRGLGEGAAARISPVVARVAVAGVPNYFGPQRFGIRRNNHLVGGALVAGDFREAALEIAGRSTSDEGDARLREARGLADQGEFGEAERAFPSGCVSERRLCRHLARHAEDWGGAIRILPRSTRTFYVNAWQSYVFNRVVEERRGAMTDVRAGDVAVKPSGVAFRVDDAAEVAGRIAAGLVELSGPLPGKRSLIGAGATGEFEWALTRAALGGRDPEPLLRASRLRGERRPLRLAVSGFACELASDHATFEFTLPSGAFATTVLAEFMGPGPAIPRLEEVRFATD